MAAFILDLEKVAQVKSTQFYIEDLWKKYAPHKAASIPIHEYLSTVRLHDHAT